MSETLNLTVDEVDALMGAIVDCDPALHAKMEKFVEERKNKINNDKKIFDDNKADIYFEIGLEMIHSVIEQPFISFIKYFNRK
jgi:hypothetical protein